RAMLPEGRIPYNALEKFPVTLGFSNEKPEQFSHPGALKFADNRVDINTGTLRLWGTFENHKRDLHPGLFIRVRMGIGPERDALFVAEAALGSDQGRRFLYVVNKETKEDGSARDVVARVPVEVGQRKNGRIAIEKGLKGDERVVVTGLQTIRPK